MPLLIFIFIVVPIIELWVLLQVGELIGLWPTIALLILDAVLGSVLLRSQGRAVWRRFNQALTERRLPHREVLDGVLVIFGGALLLTPGFVTDVFGLLLLIPPSRDLIRRFSTRLLMGRVALGGRAAYWGYGKVRGRGDGPETGPGAGPRPQGAPPPRPRSRGDYDYEGTAQEVRDESLLDPPPQPPRSEP